MARRWVSSKVIDTDSEMMQHANVQEHQYPSPLRLMVITASAIFGAEAAIMGLFLLLPALAPIAEVFLDSALVTAIALPVLYFYLYRPMTRSIAEHAHTQAELRHQSLHDSLTDLPLAVCFTIALSTKLKSHAATAPLSRWSCSTSIASRKLMTRSGIKVAISCCNRSRYASKTSGANPIPLRASAPTNLRCCCPV